MLNVGVLNVEYLVRETILYPLFVAKSAVTIECGLIEIKIAE